ncbi:hypothetical protein ATY38_14365 [Nitrosomonas ureae]|nr:hypothetical protein ATY38_14365 [Nitrosomonas ureae]
MKIDTLMNRGALYPKLTSLFKRELSNDRGQESFDVPIIFRTILLGMSDSRLEQALFILLI